MLLILLFEIIQQSFYMFFVCVRSLKPKIQVYFGFCRVLTIPISQLSSKKTYIPGTWHRTVANDILIPVVSNFLMCVAMQGVSCLHPIPIHVVAGCKLLQKSEFQKWHKWKRRIKINISPCIIVPCIFSIQSNQTLLVTIVYVYAQGKSESRLD